MPAIINILDLGTPSVFLIVKPYIRFQRKKKRKNALVIT
jgi:hypothetical protein